VLTITRHSAAGTDPNAGNMFIYGVSFDYLGDM
jgi:hypothetical protein